MAGALIAVRSLWRRLGGREDGGLGRGGEFPRPKGAGGVGCECCAPRGILTGALQLALAVSRPTRVDSAGAGVTNPPCPPDPYGPFTWPFLGMELLRVFAFKGHGLLQSCAFGRVVGKWYTSALGVLGGGRDRDTAAGIREYLLVFGVSVCVAFAFHWDE